MQPLGPGTLLAPTPCWAGDPRAKPPFGHLELLLSFSTQGSAPNTGCCAVSCLYLRSELQNRRKPDVYACLLLKMRNKGKILVTFWFWEPRSEQSYTSSCTSTVWSHILSLSLLLHLWKSIQNLTSGGKYRVSLTESLSWKQEQTLFAFCSMLHLWHSIIFIWGALSCTAFTPVHPDLNTADRGNGT